MQMERLNTDAFYTSRVDENGNEVEVTHTARTMEMPPRTTRSNLSSRESSRSVKYVNPAVYIEKSNIEDSRSGSAISLPSLANSDIVPPLDLQSEECYPTRREGYTFSYRNHYEPVKLDSNPDVAYNNWLSAKRKILSDEAARRKREKEAKKREQEERKRLAEEKYHKWLQSKQQHKSQKAHKDGEQQLIKNKSTTDELTTRAKLEEWERKKREQEERRREMKRIEEAKRKRDEEKRRLLSEEAWEKWAAEAPFKPKPVPLNQGIDTLRGTISDIFINPNEWRTE